MNLYFPIKFRANVIKSNPNRPQVWTRFTVWLVMTEDSGDLPPGLDNYIFQMV